MAHISENSDKLDIQIIRPLDLVQLQLAGNAKLPEVYLFRFPGVRTDKDAEDSADIFERIADFCMALHEDSTICVLTTPPDAARFLKFLEARLHFQLWVAVKIKADGPTNRSVDLPNRHYALLVFTRYKGSLRHTKTRINYTYCPACGKTTKDYGGKKHTYHHYGTLMSDIWRDISYSPSESNENDVVQDRLRDLFGLAPYKTLQVIDMRSCSEFLPQNAGCNISKYRVSNDSGKALTSQLINADCLEALRCLPDASVDYCFADPPYNIKKKYDNWNDEMELIEYFDWCDQWLFELARVLKLGRTLSVINIPLYVARHYQYLCTILDYQSWIAWEGLSLPVRMIMPAHYGIVCFSKGAPRPIQRQILDMYRTPYADVLNPLEEDYCLRATCVSRRQRRMKADRGELTDLWHDIHRLKHNSRRVDHPCQLPPHLMARLIAMFTEPNEVVLDCFNGAGTTTLVAQQLGRAFIGIEMSPYYHEIALQRHQLVEQGANPFAKNDDVPKAKNSRVKRLPKQKYVIPKKQLQLDIRRIAVQLGHLPSRADVVENSKYPIEYYDQYFVSWGEVCAAARTTGMTELPPSREDLQIGLDLFSNYSS